MHDSKVQPLTDLEIKNLLDGWGPDKAVDAKNPIFKSLLKNTRFYNRNSKQGFIDLQNLSVFQIRTMSEKPFKDLVGSQGWTVSEVLIMDDFILQFLSNPENEHELYFLDRETVNFITYPSTSAMIEQKIIDFDDIRLFSAKDCDLISTDHISKAILDKKLSVDYIRNLSPDQKTALGSKNVQAQIYHLLQGGVDVFGILQNNREETDIAYQVLKTTLVNRASIAEGNASPTISELDNSKQVRLNLINRIFNLSNSEEEGRSAVKILQDLTDAELKALMSEEVEKMELISKNPNLTNMQKGLHSTSSEYQSINQYDVIKLGKLDIETLKTLAGVSKDKAEDKRATNIRKLTIAGEATPTQVKNLCKKSAKDIKALVDKISRPTFSKNNLDKKALQKLFNKKGLSKDEASTPSNSPKNSKSKRGFMKLMMSCLSPSRK
jgi:hypothetical protein